MVIIPLHSSLITLPYKSFTLPYKSFAQSYKHGNHTSSLITLNSDL